MSRLEDILIVKSDIYKHYCYAFKFVNIGEVCYPDYFESGSLPIGTILADLGVYVNDFKYGDEQKVAASRRWTTDPGTARAYRVSLALSESDGDVECIALSHESGFEIFLVAAATFAGVEIAKYSLKTVLDATQKRINKWWNSRRNTYASGPPAVLTEKILVRTPYWEICIDGRFTEEERSRLIAYLAKQLPVSSISLFFERLDDGVLVEKVIAATRPVVSYDVVNEPRY